MASPVEESKSSEELVAQPDIARALREAFGEVPVESVALLPGGRSGATLLSFVAGGAGYVLRRPSPARPGHAFRTARELACMTIAAERGVAPRLRHLDAGAGIAIMDRIAVAPREAAFRASPERLARVASVLRRLHDGPAFPPGMTVIDMVRHADTMLRDAGTEGLPERLSSVLDEVAALTKRFAESAPCHNDLNPGNILETIDAAYFVDWETAGQADPFVDLAELGVFAFPAPAQRAQVLDAYLGREASAEERARMTVARVMALGFYAAAFVGTMGMTRGSTRLAAEPRPLADVFAMLGSGQAAPDVVAVSLVEEMRREWQSAACEAAKRTLA